MMTATVGRTPCEKRIDILPSNVATSLSSKYKEFGHFTLLLCRGRQRNAPRFKTHVHSHCSAHALNLLFGVAIVTVAVVVC